MRLDLPEDYFDPHVVVPDSIEPILAWKSLRLNDDGELCSPSFWYVWPERERAEARCPSMHYAWTPAPSARARQPALNEPPEGVEMFVTSSISVPLPFISIPLKPEIVLPPGLAWSWEPKYHDAPAEDCTCGIYAVNNPSDCSGYANDDCVLVQIAFWGKCVIASDGLRAQYGYPKKILVNDRSELAEAAERAAVRYGLEIEYIPNVHPKEVRYTREENIQTSLAGDLIFFACLLSAVAMIIYLALYMIKAII